ncbi:MAG: hypothetical protein PHR35_09300 [Kiritimatiellae bacterium]|nr:hypothetical protein [Kiritimatiellia bacterium]
MNAAPALPSQTGKLLHRSGVALIVVLGLLALLMITAVAFTIMMRVERSGASNLRHATAARQMAKGALAYAIAAIDDNVGDDIYPAWTNRIYTTKPEGRTGRELRLAEDIFISVDEDEDSPGSVAHARVLSDRALAHIPQALRPYVEIIKDSRDTADDPAYAQPEWIPVRAEDGIVGRYAYAIVNVSGLLDANFVHGTNHWLGASPGEIRLHPDAEPDVADADDFANDRDDHGRYDTLEELTKLNTGLHGDELANFEVFSYALPEMIPVTSIMTNKVFTDAHDRVRAATGGRKIFIGQKTGESQTAYVNRLRGLRTTIEDAFKACGIYGNNGDQSTWAYRGLIDYVDADNVPEGSTDLDKFGRPATEAVPMVQQVALNIEYTRSGPSLDVPPKYSHKIVYTVAVTLGYPFPGAPDSTFRLEGDFVFAANAWNTTLDPLLPFTVVGNTTEVFPFAAAPAWVGGNRDCQHVIISTIEKEVRDTTEAGPPPKLTYSMAIRACVKSGSEIVDAVPFDYQRSDWDQSGDLLMVQEMEQALVPNGPAQTMWWETIDPRLNWSKAVDFWRISYTKGDSYTLEALSTEPLFSGYTPDPGASVSLGSLAAFSLNHPKVLSDYFGMVVDGVRDGDDDTTHCDDPSSIQYRAHVANRPLQSVGELGYLPIGHWLTITLYDHRHVVNDYNGTTTHHDYPNNTLPPCGYHPVLDYFTVRDPDQPVRGLVNINTRNTEALAAVFNELPLRWEYAPTILVPAPAPAQSGSFDDSLELAAWVKSKGPFTRLSELSRIFQGTTQIGAAIGSGVPAVKEPVQLLAKAAGNLGFGEFEREALIRNACELLTTRQQIFTILIRADAFSSTYGMEGVSQGNVLATATAVAQVWRDPVPDAEGNHPCFVQYFKILDE